MSKRLAGVFAHPDDDTHGVGGVLLLGPDIAYTVVVLTSGDAGVIAEGSGATRQNLADVRESEERAAVAALGHAGAALHFLRYPDGGLADAPREEAVSRVVEILRRARADVVVTFGPDGVTGHPDHVAAGEIATEAFRRLGVESPGGGPKLLLYNVLSKRAADEFFAEMRRRGEDWDPNAPLMPRGVDEDDIAVEVDCSTVIDRKIEALRAHRTQAADLDAVPEDLRRRAFGREWFVQAWPPRPASGRKSRHSSVFGPLEAITASGG